jgi:uncharacterized integral membrane protein
MTPFHRLLIPLGIAMMLAFVVGSMLFPSCDDAGSAMWGVTCDE